MIDTVLFDLDGTLLPMNQEKFVHTYMGLLAQKMSQYGYEPKQLVKTVWEGTGAMVKNDGRRTNEEVFWELFYGVYGKDAQKDVPAFEEFYAKDFCKVQSSCGFEPLAPELIRVLKEKGYRLALATNPLFPATATHQRIGWAGLKAEDFEVVTTYEECRYCKPTLAYYQNVLDRLGVRPEQCMMIGNDVGEDMVTQQLGMETYLLTDCLINRGEADINAWRHGSMAELLEFVKENM